MNLETFNKQIEAASERLGALLEQANEISPKSELLDTALQELSNSLEEINVAMEELYEQNEQLLRSDDHLREERQRYQELFEFAPDGYLVTDTRGTIQEANRAAATLLNLSQAFLRGQPLAVLVATQDCKVFRDLLKQLQQGESTQGVELRLKPRRQPPLDAALKVAPAYDGHRQLVGLRWSIRDISDRKRAEESLQQTRAQLQAVLDAVPGAIAWVGSDLRFIGVNLYFARICGSVPDAFAGKNLDWYEGGLDLRKLAREFFARSEEEASQEIEVKLNGQSETYLLVAQKYGEGQAVFVAIDISELRQAQSQIEVALGEKNVLLQEVHHRVRNNLQLIATLLYNKSFKLEDLKAIAILKTLQQRVIIMAEIHKQLYRSENLAKIELGLYLGNLVTRLERAYFKADREIPVVTENYQPAVFTEMDIAHNCGLIINELFSNSISYAFPEKAFPENRSNEISLSLSSDPQEGKFTLTYGDNGVGLPGDLEITDLQRASGIRLVYLLVKNMYGQLDIERGKGTKFNITLTKLLGNSE